MVDGQHHRASGRRIEHAGETVLHAPVELVRTFQEKSRRGLRAIGLITLTRLIGFRHEMGLYARFAYCGFGATCNGLLVAVFLRGALAMHLARKVLRASPVSF